MNKIFIVFILLLSLNTMAAVHTSTKLIPGKQVLIDVANQEVVSLMITTSNPDSGLLPEVSIEKEWSGFECDHKTTLLRKAGFNLRSWEIQITWSPGADLSGCIVKIAFPGMKDSHAELFMNY